MSRAAAAQTQPTGLRRVGDAALGIAWADHMESILPLRAIRLDCGCAGCKNELSGAPTLDPASVPADIRAERITPVGRYALTFQWSDGHTTGIFPWEQLRALADRLEVTGPIPP